MVKSHLKNLGLLLGLAFYSVSVRAQEDSKILHFNGGAIRNQITVSSNLFYGLGGRSANLGGSGASFHPDAAMAYWNPAQLAALGQPGLQFDLNPALSLDLASLAALDPQVRSATDDAISEYRDPALNPTYSQIGLGLKQQNMMASVAIAWPMKQFTLAGYFHRPLALHLESMISGIRAQITTRLEQDDVFLNSFVDGNLDLQFGLSVKGLAMGRKITPKYHLGLAIERYSTRLSGSGYLNVEGTMITGGKEFAFNDPNDNWYNQLNQVLEAEYDGGGWGWKLAGSYLVQENLQFQALVEWAPNIHTHGFANIVNNTIPALSLSLFGAEDDDPEAEILDPEKLKLSQLTLTRQIDSETHAELLLKLPKTLKLGVAWRSGLISVHANYSLGFSPVAIQYGDHEIGLKPSHILRLGFDFKYLQAGIGFAALNRVMQGSTRLTEGDGATLWLPLFSLATGVDWLEHYRIDLLAIAVPLPVLKMTFGYRF